MSKQRAATKDISGKKENRDKGEKESGREKERERI
jgi:hypothetical protein